MIIDHIGISVSDYPLSKQFYSRALEPLGIKLVMEAVLYSGYGSA